MMKTLPLAAALLLAPVALAQQPIYAQCGGIGWTGATSCASGSSCQEVNSYYSQCLPGSAPAPVSSPAAPASTAPVASATPPAASAAPTPGSTSFVKTSGQSFTVGGQPFVAAGTNAYWLAQLGSTADINQAFADIAALGLTVVRTWGFNDVTSPSGTYYQLWANGVGTLNTGATGLEVFDTVVASAKAHNIRLIVTLTNNWDNYGGMDVYVQQIIGSSGTHDQFYSSSQIISAYEKYIAGWVNRYLDEPTIMAWELANEPRCAGSGDIPSSSSCNTNTITTWATTISKYIKSIDSNHLVGMGDEGFFNEPGNSDYPYSGGAGIDFNANLAIPSIDFGTLHLYPGSWGETNAWGTTWIANHAASQQTANKPVIMEEFGVTSDQASTYQTWYQEVISSGLSGALYWQAGSHLPSGDTPQDGYAIYPDSSAAPTIQTEAAALVAARE